jgi:hypothetical protein
MWSSSLQTANPTGAHPLEVVTKQKLQVATQTPRKLQSSKHQSDPSVRSCASFPGGKPYDDAQSAGSDWSLAFEFSLEFGF